MNIYLSQLKAHKQSIELTLQQIDNDIVHAEKSMELLKAQKEAQQQHLSLTIDAIRDQEKEGDRQFTQVDTSANAYMEGKRDV
jgi:septal ring factor EnvC (AmiA/AmiB activator)